tara:strand:+ start:117 stop:929 length:813 start_codon:yes stop_codon:yes gene_type:complete
MARRRRSGSSTTSKLVISAVVLVVVGLFSFLFLNQSPKTNQITGCPTDSTLSDRTIVLLFDTTSKLTATQEKKIRDITYQVVEKSNTFDRVRIYEVDPASEKLLKAEFDFCKPAKEDPLGNNVRQKFAKINFERRFDKIFQQADYERPTSPIIEALGSIAASFPLNGSSKHLIIASDFIENSEILNQFQSSWRSSSENNKLLEDRRPSLEGIKVSMLFIPRASIDHHNKNFSDWWKDYLKSSGARLVDQEFIDSETGQSYVLYPFIPITG